MRIGQRHSLIGCGLVLLIVMVLATGSWADEQKKVEKEFTVTPGGTLTIETDIGSISVQSSAGNTVRIEATLIADVHSQSKAQKLFDEFELSFSQSGGDVEIIGEYSDRRGFLDFLAHGRNQLDVQFVITVPQKYNLDLNTSGGDIVIGDIDGTTRAETSGGDIRLAQIKGRLRVNTSGGNISLTESTADADLQTSGGDITVELADGPLTAHTSGGNVMIREALGSVDASTSGGNIRAYIARQPQEDCRLTTSGGNVDVYLTSDISVDVDAETSGGVVSTDFPITVRGELEEASLQGPINKGGPELYLRTSGGNIHLYEK
ncbi:MAG: DUF4097 family beta strand repeat-containing protein [candidate division Zixibacteria bacterium]|nr:DUF4097 family beta strand repeat-containing protein [candidate division Zixibacteria bacterium]